MKEGSFGLAQDKSFLITEVAEVGVGLYLLWLEAPEMAEEAHPGHFFMVGCGPQVLLRRPLSLHRLGKGDRKGEMAFLFRVVGKGTRWLSERRSGEGLEVLGPLGRGYSLGPGGPVLALAGGLGIAPLLALAEEALAQGLTVTLLYGARTQGELYPVSLLPQGINLVLATEDGSVGERGRVTDILPRILEGHLQIFACGPRDMYRSLQEMSLRYPGLGRAQVSVEERMGCGRGACLGCSLPTRAGMKRACWDGPVFELGELVL